MVIHENLLSKLLFYEHDYFKTEAEESVLSDQCSALSALVSGSPNLDSIFNFHWQILHTSLCIDFSHNFFFFAFYHNYFRLINIIVKSQDTIHLPTTISSRIYLKSHVNGEKPRVDWTRMEVVAP